MWSYLSLRSPEGSAAETLHNPSALSGGVTVTGKNRKFSIIVFILYVIKRQTAAKTAGDRNGS